MRDRCGVVGLNAMLALWLLASLQPGWRRTGRAEERRDCGDVRAGRQQRQDRPHGGTHPGCAQARACFAHRGNKPGGAAASPSITSTSMQAMRITC